MTDLSKSEVERLSSGQFYFQYCETETYLVLTGELIPRLVAHEVVMWLATRLIEVIGMYLKERNRRAATEKEIENLLHPLVFFTTESEKESNHA